ncbi:MAG: radical SAM protein [Opitutales bacterium]|nr:radical SAM protein [Opitutales bacterium]
MKSYAVARYGEQVDIRIKKNPEEFMSAVAEKQPDIIGFANYGWNENLTREIGSWTRRLVPNALIVSGGPNIDENSDLQLDYLKRHDYLDCAIVGGGEEPFSELIEWWASGDRNLKLLPPNIIRIQDGKLHATGERELKKVIDNIESPYLNGYLDEFLEAGLFPMFETNRGCPFKCSFCAWGSASKDLVRRLDLDIALAEIDYVSQRSSSNVWIFCDANFGILKRDVEIAKSIRNAKDQKGYPDKVHVWLAKNATERNLEIGEILGDMVVPVMAVQSLDQDVLEKIKRDNISTETYVEYQKKFHDLGHKTYSDLIVPLPGETLESHLEALRSLVSFGVDIITSNNMRLLAGAETNLPEVRSMYGFESRYRLIHGDAGIYRQPDGSEIKVFEYEESLRRTTTMSEEDLFFLRKLHFLIDCAWNVEVYKPILGLGLRYGINPIDVLIRLLRKVEETGDELSPEGVQLFAFFADFEKKSHGEWFDTSNDIEAYFADETNFSRLINQEFEKLNTLYTVILLKDYKSAFDSIMLQLLAEVELVPADLLRSCAEYTFALFPPLDVSQEENVLDIPEELLNIIEKDAVSPEIGELKSVRLIPSPRRSKTREIIISKDKSKTLSKILNTQGIELSDLRFAVDQSYAYDKQFRRSTS